MIPFTSENGIKMTQLVVIDVNISCEVYSSSVKIIMPSKVKIVVSMLPITKGYIQNKTDSV
jgi:hypothetical protein